MLELQPISFEEAASYIRAHHRHHKPPQSWLFGTAVNDGHEVVGVICVGRPVSRMLQDGYTAEVTRCCTNGHHNACSMLYGAAWRAARALGYRRLMTYTLPEEGGSSLRAAGYELVGTTCGGSWSREGRPRVDKHPLGQKMIWQKRDD